jgi:hypothetical protein
MDPLNCYCSKDKCDKLDDDNLGDDHEWMDASDKEDDHWPVSGFDTVGVQCKDGKFPQNRGTGNGNSDTIRCMDNLKWTAPGACVELGCSNPRIDWWLAASFNSQHTCASLDRINIGAGAVAWDDDTIIFANTLDNGEHVGFSKPRVSHQVYLTSHIDSDLEATVKNGAVATFTCKKGFAPYYNADVAASIVGDTDPFGAKTGTGFDCICEDGEWVCLHHCRCEGFCPVDE